MGIFIDAGLTADISTALPTYDPPAATAHEIARWQHSYAAADVGALGATVANHSSVTEAPRQTADELAQRYAPVLVVPDGDYDLPADPVDFIENSRWRTDRTARPDSIFGIGQHGDNTDGDRSWWGFGGEDTSDNFSAAQIGSEGESNQFLDLDDDKRDELGSVDAPFFYEAETDANGNTSRITYWFFYAHNDGPGPQNHEGDFERITIGFDPVTQEPIRARYSAHSNAHTEAVDFDKLETFGDTGRPVVYVAEGTHASYMHAGDYTSDAPWIGGIGVLDDNTVSSINDDSATIIDTSNNLHEATSQDWYPQRGDGVHWGEIGDADGLPFWGGSSSGPHGPSVNKNHLDLD